MHYHFERTRRFEPYEIQWEYCPEEVGDCSESPTGCGGILSDPWILRGRTSRGFLARGSGEVHTGGNRANLGFRACGAVGSLHLASLAHNLVLACVRTNNYIPYPNNHTKPKEEVKPFALKSFNPGERLS